MIDEVLLKVNNEQSKKNNYMGNQQLKTNKSIRGRN